MKPNRERDEYFCAIGAPPPTQEERLHEVADGFDEVAGIPPLDDAPPGEAIDYERGETEPQQAEVLEPLDFVDVAEWDGHDVPEREWVIANRIPRRNVSLLTGDGAAGKTTIALQAGVATLLGGDWFGALVDAPGPVMFVTAEEDKDEVWRRLHAIARERGKTLADLHGFHVRCLETDDATLWQVDRDGLVKPTPLFERLKLFARATRPSLIIAEAVADLAGVNEVVRRQVLQAIRCARAFAVDVNCGFLLIGHPSQSGISSGSGTSGSTHWHNAVRSRMYFTATGDKDDDEQSDERLLRFMKNNYGPLHQPVRLRWERGVYVPVGGVTTVERAAAEARVDAAFLKCLAIKTAQGLLVGPNHGANYAPSVFAKMQEAEGARSKALAAAMERALSAGRVKVVKTGPASKERTILVRAVDADG